MVVFGGKMSFPGAIKACSGTALDSFNRPRPALVTPGTFFQTPLGPSARQQWCCGGVEKKSPGSDQSASGPIEYIDGGIGTSIDCSPKAHLGAVTAQKCLYEPSRGVRREV